MTTTNLFQGMDPDAKPSSKVLRPPGGTSSNIFGGYEDTPPRAEPIAKGPDVVAAGAPTPLKPNGNQDVVTDRDRLFGGGQCTDVKIKQAGNQKNQGSLNPITGLPNYDTRYKNHDFKSKSDTALPTTPERPAKRRGHVNPKTGQSVNQNAPSPQPTAERSAKKRGYYHPEGFNPITGQPISTSEYKETNGSEFNNNRGTYNPLTGADLTEPKEQVSVLPPREMKVPHTSTRVRQPPGGASSGLW